MEQELIFDGKSYISSKNASRATGYAKDYIGQLCRGGKLECRMVGRSWHISKTSLKEYDPSFVYEGNETVTTVPISEASKPGVIEESKSADDEAKSTVRSDKSKDIFENRSLSSELESSITRDHEKDSLLNESVRTGRDEISNDRKLYNNIEITPSRLSEITSDIVYYPEEDDALIPRLSRSKEAGYFGPLPSNPLDERNDDIIVDFDQSRDVEYSRYSTGAPVRALFSMFSQLPYVRIAFLSLLVLVLLTFTAFRGNSFATVLDGFGTISYSIRGGSAYVETPSMLSAISEAFKSLVRLF